LAAELGAWKGVNSKNVVTLNQNVFTSGDEDHLLSSFRFAIPEIKAFENDVLKFAFVNSKMEL